MAIQTDLQRKNLATAYGTNATYGSMYTTAPGSSAGTEVSGGSPAFARKALTWSTPATVGSTAETTATAVFDIPASTTVVGAGVHTASTGGSYLDGASITSQAFATQGTYTATFKYVQS